MQRLVLFDLDDTLIDRRGAFTIWADEFAATHGLDDKWTTWLVMADAHHGGPMDTFFATVRDQFELAEPVERLWQQYRRRMPELGRLPQNLSMRSNNFASPAGASASSRTG